MGRGGIAFGGMVGSPISIVGTSSSIVSATASTPRVLRSAAGRSIWMPRVVKELMRNFGPMPPKVIDIVVVVFHPPPPLREAPQGPPAKA